VPLHMSVSGPKSSPNVRNGVTQISAEFQWQWQSFLNSNGVFQKRWSYNVIDPINPMFKQG
jgi:hypothetical protein